MVEETSATTAAIDFVTAMNTKLNNIEEKSELLREKIIALDKTFFSQEEKLNKEISLVKEDIKKIKEDLMQVSEGLQGVFREFSNFARKEELRALDRVIKMWEPLKFVKVDEAKEMIKEEIEKTLGEKENKSIHTHIG